MEPQACFVLILQNTGGKSRWSQNTLIEQPASEVLCTTISLNVCTFMLLIDKINNETNKLKHAKGD